MKIREVIRKQIRHSGQGIEVAADVNAVVMANVDHAAKPTDTRSKQSVKPGREDQGGRDEGKEPV